MDEVVAHIQLSRYNTIRFGLDVSSEGTPGVSLTICQRRKPGAQRDCATAALGLDDIVALWNGLLAAMSDGTTLPSARAGIRSAPGAAHRVILADGTVATVREVGAAALFSLGRTEDAPREWVTVPLARAHVRLLLDGLAQAHALLQARIARGRAGGGSAS